jgi:hypothetical protein
VNEKPDPNDPTTWPVADAVPTDVFLGAFIHDCTPDLTEEQKKWPVADAVPTDVFLGAFTETCTPTPKASEPSGKADHQPQDADQTQPAPPAHP